MAATLRFFLAGLRFRVTPLEVLSVINEILPEKSMVGWEQIKIIRKGQYRPGATCCAFISVKSENDQLLLVRELHDAYEQRLTDQRLRCEKAVPREASAQPEIQAAGEANAEPEIQTAGTEANAEPEIQTAGPQANAKPEMETAAEATRIKEIIAIEIKEAKQVTQPDIAGWHRDSKAGEPSEMEEPAAEVQQGKPPKSKAKAKAKATAMKLQPMKFSAKAKAKVQAKAKAKATAKAKAKSSSAPGAMKRPSSSGHSVHDLKDNIEKTTTQEAQDGAQHRDKGKGIKYQRQKADLPGYVVALIEEETKKSSSPGAAKTNLINKLYRKEKDGTLSLQLSDPTFAEAQKIYNKKYKRTEDEAIPESLMLELYFHGDRSLFDAALKKGEVFKVTGEDSDVDFFAFRKFVVGAEDGKESIHETNSRKKLTNSDLDALKSAFRTLKWTFNFTKSH
eukprot:s8978_g3.t1